MKSITRVLPASNWENYKNYRRQLFRSFQAQPGGAARLPLNHSIKVGVDFNVTPGFHIKPEKTRKKASICRDLRQNIFLLKTDLDCLEVAAMQIGLAGIDRTL